MAVRTLVQPWAAWLVALGLVGTALVLFAPVLAGDVGCDTAVISTLLIGAMATAALVVRLPTAISISLLVAVLLPAWLSCGGPATAAIAFAASLVGGAVSTRAILPTALGAAGALAGALIGHLVGSVILASDLLQATGAERLVAGASFVVAYWLAELMTVRLAERSGLPGGAAPVARSNLVANLLLLFPAIVLADLLVSRGLLLFGPMLLLLVVALALIALYLGAEAARAGVAGEQARLEAIVAHAPEGIFAVGPSLELEWLNDTASRLTGWPTTPAVGRPCHEVVRLESADGQLVDHEAAFARAARSGLAVHTSGILRGSDGQPRPVVVSYTALTDGLGGFQIGVGAVREAEPSVEMDDRAADLGHELRSPLSTILGYARLMASTPAGSLDPARQAEFIGRIAESGDYMLRLVNNILDLRRMEHGTEALQLTTVRVEAFLNTAALMTRPQAGEKRLDLSVEVEPGLPPITTDELLARRALDNLLSNAVKYTPSGGEIRLTARRENDGVAISVIDSGIGLTEEDRARLFERFFRGSRPEARAERGTGLGLALVREAARRLGGQVRVKSAVDQGSTFTLWLPFEHAGEPQMAGRRTMEA